MTTFDNREKAFENKYAHQQKVGFDVEARCSKLYGLWAAEQLGLKYSDANTYAMSVVEANLEEPGFEDVYRKVKGDFDEKNIIIEEAIMRAQLDKALSEAQRQILNEQNA